MNDSPAWSPDAAERRQGYDLPRVYSYRSPCDPLFGRSTHFALLPDLYPGYPGCIYAVYIQDSIITLARHRHAVLPAPSCDSCRASRDPRLRQGLRPGLAIGHQAAVALEHLHRTRCLRSIYPVNCTGVIATPCEFLLQRQV